MIVRIYISGYIKRLYTRLCYITKKRNPILVLEGIMASIDTTLCIYGTDQ